MKTQVVFTQKERIDTKLVANALPEEQIRNILQFLEQLFIWIGT